MKIYTKKGDDGRTSLFGGQKLSKADIQIEAYGTVDELNSVLGLLISKLTVANYKALLEGVQKNLFNIGSHLASDGTLDDHLPSLSRSATDTIEKAIDEMTEALPELKSFILPGGSEEASLAHLARSICRRAERRVVSLSEINEQNAIIIPYLNRLSDYLFTLARKLNHDHGLHEKPWNRDLR